MAATIRRHIISRIREAPWPFVAVAAGIVCLVLFLEKCC